eukprot:8043843-Pyramimonas_sp.AAC.1
MRKAEIRPATRGHEQLSLPKTDDHARRSSGRLIDHASWDAWASHTCFARRIRDEQATRQQGSPPRLAEVASERN